MKHSTRLKKRREEKVLEDLKFEKESLEILRDSRTLWDAIDFYLSQVIVSKKEQAELRAALQILCRGRTK